MSEVLTMVLGYVMFVVLMGLGILVFGGMLGWLIKYTGEQIKKSKEVLKEAKR